MPKTPNKEDIMHHLTKAVTGASVVGAAAGAVVGGAVSAAKQAKDVKEGKITKEEAAKKTAKDAAGAGAATAVGVAAASLLRLGGVFGILTVFAVAAGTKYLLDSSVEKACKAKEPVKSE
jgi:type IV secretory pathway TrbL component